MVALTAPAENVNGQVIVFVSDNDPRNLYREFYADDLAEPAIPTDTTYPDVAPHIRARMLVNLIHQKHTAVRIAEDRALTTYGAQSQQHWDNACDLRHGIESLLIELGKCVWSYHIPTVAHCFSLRDRYNAIMLSEAMRGTNVLEATEDCDQWLHDALRFSESEADNIREVRQRLAKEAKQNELKALPATA